LEDKGSGGTILKNIIGSDGLIKYTIDDNGSEILVRDGKTGLIKYRYVKAVNITYDSKGSIYLYGNVVLDLE
jgi:hypothetical protein